MCPSAYPGDQRDRGLRIRLLSEFNYFSYSPVWPIWASLIQIIDRLLPAFASLLLNVSRSFSHTHCFSAFGPADRVYLMFSVNVQTFRAIEVINHRRL